MGIPKQAERPAFSKERSKKVADRFIGIRPRIKQTAAQQARPTQVTIIGIVEKAMTIELVNDDEELDFVKGSHPVAWLPIYHADGTVVVLVDGKTEKVSAADEMERCNPRHVKWRKVKKDESLAHLDPRFFRTRETVKGDVIEVASDLPFAFVGLAKGDSVAMALGGSGDRFAFALSNRGEQIGARVYRIPTYGLKAARIAAGVREDKKDDDARILAESLQLSPGSFTLTEARDRDLILLREVWIRRVEAMKARIGCEQRLHQHFIGNVFCNPDGYYPEGSVEVAFDALRSNDSIYQALCMEEETRAAELTKVVKRLEVFRELFEPIEGVGPMIAARIIVAIGDIRRFGDRLETRITEAGLACREEKRLGSWDEGIALVNELQPGRITEGMHNFQLTQIVRNQLEQLGRTEDVAHLNRALELYELIHVLKGIRKSHLKLGWQTSCLKAFAGVHVFRGGKYGDRPIEKQFVRRRAGDVANWHPDLRQALWLLGEQFNRRPGSVWGQRLLANKAELYLKHGAMCTSCGTAWHACADQKAHKEFLQVGECTTCKCPWHQCPSQKIHKRIHSAGHLHKQAIWRTVTQFVEWLWEAWWQLELRRNPVNPATGDEAVAAS